MVRGWLGNFMIWLQRKGKKRLDRKILILPVLNSLEALLAPETLGITRKPTFVWQERANKKFIQLF